VCVPRSGRGKDTEGRRARSLCRRPTGSRVLYIHLKFKPVVTKLHVRVTERTKAVIGLCVGKFVCDVSEPCAAGLEAIDELEGLFDRLVHGMWRIAQRVDDEIVEILEKRNGRFRDGAEVREISGAAKAEAEDV